MPALHPFSHAFGLDLGDRTFRLVQVLKRVRSPHYRLIAWAETVVPDGVIEHGDIKDTKKAADLIVKLLKSAGGRLRGSSVVAALPENRTFIKIIDLPSAIEGHEFQEALLEKLEQNFPLPRNEIYFDSQNVPARADAAKRGLLGGRQRKPRVAEHHMRSVIVAAAPRSIADGYVQMLETAGLAPIALEMEAMAAARAMITDRNIFEGPVGILDIGATESSLVIFDAGVIQMSVSIASSGEEITHALSQALGVDFAEAETLKCRNGLVGVERVSSALMPIIDAICAKIKNALRFYKLGFPRSEAMKRILLSGGGAQLAGLDKALTDRLSLTSEKADPLVNVAARLPKTFPKDRALAFATAIGVAISAADRHEEFKEFSV